MKANKNIVAKNAVELAEALGLSAADAATIELRSDLNDKIINIVKKHQLTHEEVAKLAGASRTRITAILNRKTTDISTDLMIRIVHALGYKAKVVVSQSRSAA